MSASIRRSKTYYHKEAPSFQNLMIFISFSITAINPFSILGNSFLFPPTGSHSFCSGTASNQNHSLFYSLFFLQHFLWLIQKMIKKNKYLMFLNWQFVLGMMVAWLRMGVEGCQLLAFVYTNPSNSMRKESYFASFFEQIFTSIKPQSFANLGIMREG